MPPSFNKVPQDWGIRGLIETISAVSFRFRNRFGMTVALGIAVVFGTGPLRKRCRILPAGGLGVPPSLIKSPKIGGLGG